MENCGAFWYALFFLSHMSSLAKLDALGRQGLCELFLIPSSAAGGMERVALQRSFKLSLAKV